jgi:pimeloyl-ACP methyl ester carboxylesterase
MEELRVAVNGIDLFALAAGRSDAPLVLLLHGFPELSRSWRHQLPALAAAGFRAVAPDLRGYGRSGKAGPYDLRTLAADVAALVRSLGRDRATIVGHDWGGAIAWAAASYEAPSVERLVILNCPHPAVLARELVVNPRQLRRQRYVLFFQLPLLPEWWLTRSGAAAVGRALRGGSHVRAAWPREETLHYQRAFLEPGAARAALGYYRAMFRGWRGLWRAARARPVAVPTLVLWGARDRFLGIETIALEKMTPFFVPGNTPKIRVLEEAGHFVQNEAPDRVNAELCAWLTSATAP